MTYRSQSGFSFLFVLFAIVLVGLSMMGANTQWMTMMKREREAELLFRGEQYRRAIQNYVDPPQSLNVAIARTTRQYPKSVDDLLKDERTGKLRRHLRSAYMDPITGGPFFAVPCKDRIKGVYSPSEALTLKQDNFPPQYEQFRTTSMYREWVFEYPGAAGSPPPVPVQQGLMPPAIPPIPC